MVSTIVFVIIGAFASGFCVYGTMNQMFENNYKAAFINLFLSILNIICCILNAIEISKAIG